MKHRINLEYIEVNMKIDGEVHGIRSYAKDMPPRQIELIEKYPERILGQEAEGLLNQLLLVLGEAPKIMRYSSDGSSKIGNNPKFVEKYGESAVQEYFDARKQDEAKS